MDAFRFSRWLISYSLAALLCGCGGGGGGGAAALPPVSPGAPVQSSAALSVPFTIALPSASSPSGSARRPRYVSAGTKSASIAYAGQKQVINCANDACTGLLAVPPGQVTFVATLFDQTNAAGNALAQGQTDSTIVAGQPNHIQITFGGVVASLAVTLAPSTVPAGTPATVPVVVTAKDAAGYTIVGSTAFTSPVAVADDDASGATALSATSLDGPAAVTALAYNGSGNGATVHVTARAADPAVAPASATLTIGAKPTPVPSATPVPTASPVPTPVPTASPAPTPVPTPVPGPSQDPRVRVWSMGDPWGLPATTDGQNPNGPVFSGTPATCVAQQGAAQCTGGTGAASFHVERADTTTIPAAQYRNMMVLQTWNADKSYAFNYQLVPDGAYDVRFQTVNHMKDDARYVQSLIWQNHAGDGTVSTALGVENYDGNGNEFYFNAGGHEGGIADPFPWHGTTAQGGVDTWEVQFRNSQDASGWIDLYRNGQRVVHYSGPVVKTTAYDLMSFGIYYYDWEISRSTILSTDITFNYFELSTIPGPVAPAAALRTAAKR
jgi:hypothetical protein